VSGVVSGGVVCFQGNVNSSHTLSPQGENDKLCGVCEIRSLILFFPFSEISAFEAVCVCVVVCVEFHVVVATPSMKIGGTTTIDGASSHPSDMVQVFFGPFNPK